MDACFVSRVWDSYTFLLALWVCAWCVVREVPPKSTHFPKGGFPFLCSSVLAARSQLLEYFLGSVDVVQVSEVS